MKPLSYDGTVFTDLSLRLAELDRLQIDLQVLSPNPLTFLHGIEAPIAADFCQQHNTLMAAVVAEAPDRFVGLAALPIQDVPAACDVLERAVGELGLKGAMIGTDFRQVLPATLSTRSIGNLSTLTCHSSFTPAQRMASTTCKTCD